MVDKPLIPFFHLPLRDVVVSVRYRNHTQLAIQKPRRLVLVIQLWAACHHPPLFVGEQTSRQK